MKAPLFTGCATALVTPFCGDAVDVDALQKLVEWQIDQGVHALVACGTTGEPCTLSDDEWALVVETVVATSNSRVPVIAGTGGNDTRHVIALGKRAKALGAQAQLCVTPYYNKTTQQGLLAHYRAIADADTLPVILYNVPSRTGMDMPPDTVAALSQHPNIIGLKDASGDLGALAEAMQAAHPDFLWYSGCDELVVPMMALGAHGVISVLGNIHPRYVQDMCGLMLAGGAQQAAAMQKRCLPLIRALFSEVSPIPVKHALHLLGWCENTLRLPLVPMGEENSRVLEHEMKEMGLL